MRTTPGSRLGPYEIVATIGRGGMGEVFRARDTRLARDVALKVLPEGAHGDGERFRRFELEARAAGALNHPNVVVLHDVGEQDGTPYLVTELLEGETLRERLLRGPIHAQRAVEIAVQVARGLGAAHEKGIVHRDLKPENVFLTADGHAKILDFGLAKLLDPEPAEDQGAPGVAAATRSDVVVGTAGYMAPEQVRGDAVDARADVFALGACLYEMLSGRRAFREGSAVDTMAAILREEPPELSSFRRGIAPQLERIVRRCLEKQKAARFQSARDLAFALEALSGSNLSIGPGLFTAVVARNVKATARRAVVPLALLAAGLAGGVFLAARYRTAPVAPPTVLRALTHSGSDLAPAASPDGGLVAFVSRRGGRSRIWMKQIHGEGETALTDGPSDSEPRFFPDGQSVLFTRTDDREGSSLWRVPVLGGEARRLFARAEAGDVSPDGREVAFLRLVSRDSHALALLVAPVTGGAEREIVRFDTIVWGPRWSPGGGTIALSEEGSTQSGIPGSVVLVSREGRIRRLPLPRASRLPTSVAWLGDGTALLVGVFDGTVPQARTVGLELVKMEVEEGDASVVGWWPAAGRTIDVLGDGRLVFESVTNRESLREVSLRGERPVLWLTHGTAADRQPVYSPDGKWILFSSDRSGQLDLWMLSRETGALRRVTDDAAQDWDPSFSPDGGRILWSSDRSGRFQLWTASVDGSDARLLSKDAYEAENPVLTPDGRTLLWGSLHRGREGIWKADADGGNADYLARGLTLQLPEVSPDGRLVAFRVGFGIGPRAVRIVRLADGGEVLSIPLDVSDGVAGVEVGRPRFMPDGRIAFLALDESGVAGVWVQDVVPGRDTTATRRKLAGFDPVAPAESFGISPDGAAITIAARESLSSIVLAEPVAGVERPRRR